MKIAIIGTGVIGSSLARHFSKKHSVLISDRHREKGLPLAQEINGEFISSPTEAIQKAEIIILAIKPKDLSSFAKEHNKAFSKNQILISVLAGTLVALLKNLFPNVRIVRIMPNLPMICGEGVIGFVNDPEITPDQKKQIEEIFQGLGLLRWLSEDQLEALSALAGSGPAFIYVLIEALMDSGVLLGFTQDQAREFVLQTIEGSIALLKSTGKHPAELKAKVTSPGGTTIAGLKVLEDAGIRGILMDTIQATYQRAQDLKH